MRPVRRAAAFAVLSAVLLAGVPAWAHHRQTPPVLAFTTSGDTDLPRVDAPGRKSLALAIQNGPDQEIVTIAPYQDPTVQTPLATTGDNRNPAISFTGRSTAWDTTADPTGSGLPGRQVVASLQGMLFPISNDPTGSSANPSVDTAGLRIAFESTGDLGGTGNPGARQVFLAQPTGNVVQVSQGVGTSRNPVVSAKKGILVFESSSDAGTGADTGVFQIWLSTNYGSTVAPITAGGGSSINPAVSDDGRIIAFQSTADLAGTGVDTGVEQVFTYDTKSKTYARITNDAGGCTQPAVAQIKRDWRIAFVCSGLPYYYMLRDDQRYLVQTGGGTTQRVSSQFGVHFLVLSTTANLLGGGTTPGHQVYMVNLFKRPAEPVAGLAQWFPFRGINPL